MNKIFNLLKYYLNFILYNKFLKFNYIKEKYKIRKIFNKTHSELKTYNTKRLDFAN